MILRYKIGFTERIVDADYIEIESTDSVECHDGKWVFKDGECIDCTKTDTYTSSESEVTE